MTGATRRTRQPKQRAPLTLAVDIGGTGVKAAVLRTSGSMVADRVVIPTPYPCPPDVLLRAIGTLVKQLPDFDRIAMGFPGMVRDGRVLWAPEFNKVGGLGTKFDQGLEDAWEGYDLAAAATEAFGRPTLVVNDADLHGLAVVSGHGLELVLTLGTGIGTGVFQDGLLAPHLEIAHHPFRNDQTYTEQIGDAARKRLTKKEWNARVQRAVETLHALLFFDHVYIGGGNSGRVTVDLGPKASIVDNSAGILGGIALWDQFERRARQVGGG